jgi:hypothetical protein
MDFGEVDTLIRPGTILPPEAPLEAFATAAAPAAVEEPPELARPDVLSWSPPAEEISPRADLSAPPMPAPLTPAPQQHAVASRPREPWVYPFLVIQAYVCMAFGILQLVAVALAVVTRRAGVSPWMLLVSVGGLLAAGTLGGLALLAVAVVRGMRAEQTSS